MRTRVAYLNLHMPKFEDSRRFLATGAHELYSLAFGRSRTRLTRKGGRFRGVVAPTGGAGGAGGPDMPRAAHGMAISAVQAFGSMRTACSQGFVSNSNFSLR